MKTPELIDSLAASAEPVRRLRPPLVRAALWLLLAGAILLALAFLFGLRPDLGSKLNEPVFVLSLAGSLLTGALAGLAAFLLSLPDRSRLWLALPAPPLALWLSTVGYGCLTDWVRVAPGSMTPGTTALCLLTLLLVGLPLSAAMFRSLRHAAVLGGRGATVAGAVSVGAFAASSLMLLHELDASLLVLTWNVGVLALFLGLLPPLARIVPARMVRGMGTAGARS